MKTFRESLSELDEIYLEMAKNLDRMIGLTIESLEKGEVTLASAGEVLVIEDRINHLEQDIKEESIILIARFQPAAKDLRKLLSYIDSVRLLERMGDLLTSSHGMIKSIESTEANIKIYLQERFLPLLKKIKTIYEDYIKTVISEDIPSLYSLLAMDKEIDLQVEDNTKFLVNVMKVDFSIIESGTLLLLLDRKVERVSDHITHLVENLIFSLKGDNIRRLELLDIEEKKQKKKN